MILVKVHLWHINLKLNASNTGNENDRIQNGTLKLQLFRVRYFYLSVKLFTRRDINATLNFLFYHQIFGDGHSLVVK